MLLVCMKYVNCSILFLIPSIFSFSLFKSCVLACVLLLGVGCGGWGLGGWGVGGRAWCWWVEGGWWSGGDGA